MTATTPRLRRSAFLYVDVTVEVADARGSVTGVFGPFEDRAVAEHALTVFITRENALGAIIRDPNA